MKKWLLVLGIAVILGCSSSPQPPTVVYYDPATPIYSAPMPTRTPVRKGYTMVEQRIPPIPTRTPTPLARFDISSFDNPAALMSTAIAVLEQPLDNTPPRMLGIIEATLREDWPTAKIICRSSIKYEIEIVDCEILATNEFRFVMGQHDIGVSDPERVEPQQLFAMAFWPYEGQDMYGDLQTCPPISECVYDYGVSAMEFALITQVIKAKWISELAQWK